MIAIKTKSSRFVFAIVVVIIGTIVLMMLRVQHRQFNLRIIFDECSNDQPSPTRSLNDKIIAVYWTTIFGESFEKENTPKPVLFSRCPSVAQWCQITSDRSMISIADAVLFHFVDMYFAYVPSVRWPWQRYVMVTMEPPARTPTIDLRDFFNWTMTYRRDSDVVMPYGAVIGRSTDAVESQLYASSIDDPNSTSIEGDVESITFEKFRSKSKLIVWFVSHCSTESRREFLVYRLRRYIPVDIYGACGEYRCSLSENDQCMQMLDRKYMFYLAFENSVCADYVTEKLYERLRYDAIPIVLKRSIVEGLLPNDSFIAVDDFVDISALASFLIDLSRDYNRYSHYFQWRRRYRVIDHTVDQSYCGLCNKLRSERRKDPHHSQTKSYSSIQNWWNKGSNCVKNYGAKIIR